MPKGSYGFSLVKTETYRRCQQLLLFASPKYFPENAFVLLTDLIKTTLNHVEQTDLTRPRKNRKRFLCKAATGKFFSLSNQNFFGHGTNPHLDSILHVDGEQAFEQLGTRPPTARQALRAALVPPKTSSLSLKSGCLGLGCSEDI